MAERGMYTRRVQGHVKWFDPVKGYGFVIADEGGPDILLHVNVLRNFGQSTVADNSEIDVDVRDTERGPQVMEVHAIHPPETHVLSRIEEFKDIDPNTLHLIPFEPARMKWFDRGRGYGFANIFGDSSDIFIHVDILKQGGLMEVQPGEAIAIRVVDGQNGLIAAEISNWDSSWMDSAQ